MNQPGNPSRRRFLIVSALVGGALVVGCKPARNQAAAAATLNAWVRIDPDGSIAIVCPRNEMGQDVYTALTMLVAEELAVDPGSVSVAHAPVDPAWYGNQLLGGAQMTGGSTSTRDAWIPLRQAGAAARTMLVGAAAAQWKVPATECRAENGYVLHGSDRLAYGALAAAAAKQEPPKQVALKPAAQFTVIGKPLPRLDGAGKARGQTVFGIDVAQPGMLYAALVPCPVLGGKVASFDGSAAEQRAGVRKVVSTGDGVAVVADHYWIARSALNDLRIQWDEGPAAGLDTAAIYAALENARESPRFAVVKNVGDASAVLPGATRLEAMYRVQMLAHATLEPQNCLARVGPDGSVDVWASTQAPQSARDAAAKAAGVQPEQVRIHPQFIGGGFGRRLDVDFVPQAVLIAKAVPGTPVKLIWSREDDTTHDFYRPPSLHVLRAAVDGARLVALTHTMISPSVTARMFPTAVKDGIDDFMVEGVKNLTYDIPNLMMRTIIQDVGIRTGYWRSVSNANNAWAIESFMDEVAHAARTDPLALRLALLARLPRQQAVLQQVARAAGYPAPQPGHAVGLASMECYDSYVAVAATVSGGPDKVKLEKLWIAADCGIVVHPDQAIAQLEGGMLNGLINAVRGKVTFRNGRAEQTGFHDFRIPRMNEVPPVTVIQIASIEKPSGLGEVGVPLVAPAIGNAVYKLTGQRIRALPLEDGGITFV